MPSSDQIIQHAVDKGWLRPGQGLRDLSPGHYRRAAIAVRPGREKVVDGFTAVESLVATTINPKRVVPLHVAGSNRSICENCPDGLFALLRFDKPACTHTRCNCSDRWLESKWKDRRHKCPAGYWDNTQVPT